MKKITIDYDDTLIDFSQPFFRQINSHINEDTQISFENERLFKKEINSVLNDNRKDENFFKDIYENSQFFDFSIDFLNFLKNEGFDIVVITSSMSSEQKKHKLSHIEKNISPFISEVISARKKYVHSKGSIFIDDNIKNVILHCENNKEDIGILFNFKKRKIYSEKDLNRLSSFDNVKYIDNFEGVLSLIKSSYLKKNPKKPETKNKGKSRLFH